MFRRDLLKGSIFGGFTLGLSKFWQSKPIPEKVDIDTPELDSFHRPLPVYSTGIPDLDESLKGGLRQGLYIVAGDEHTGKSSLLHSIAQSNRKQTSWLNPFLYSIVHSRQKQISWSRFPQFKQSLRTDDPEFLAHLAQDDPIILIDGLLLREMRPENNHPVFSTENITRIAMKYGLVVVVTVRTKEFDDHTNENCNHWRTVMFANGFWVLNGETLTVIKERYGQGKYGPNQGIIPWGPRSLTARV